MTSRDDGPADSASLLQQVPRTPAEERKAMIVATLSEAFGDLIAADPRGFRGRFRKMAAEPYAFYRGSACVFYADVDAADDPWVDDRTSRVWIQGDLHAENFGSYMDGAGELIFDVNDFDEAYLGHFTWDLQRFAASLALIGRRKALPDDTIEHLIGVYVRSYLEQVQEFLAAGNDQEFSVHARNAEGAVAEVLAAARLRSRAELLNRETDTEGGQRRFRDGPGVRRLPADERSQVLEAYRRYLDTIPTDRRMRGVAYEVKDVIGKSGVGIGSAGLPMYSLLIEGRNEALDNDLVISMKQGLRSSVSAVITDPDLAAAFTDHGHRSAQAQWALQARADPLLGHTSIAGTGFVVTEVSPYGSDLDWDELTEPADIEVVVAQLGRVTAKVHCVPDVDANAALVQFQVEEAIAEVTRGRGDELVRAVTEFGLAYAEVVRADHALFVDAFRHGGIPGVSATA